MRVLAMFYQKTRGAGNYNNATPLKKIQVIGKLEMY
jgi:hypothetical protein